MFNSFNVNNGPVQFGNLVDAPAPPDYQAPSGLGSVLGSSKMSFGMPKGIKVGLPATLMLYTAYRVYQSPNDWKKGTAGMIAMGALAVAGLQG